MKSQIKITVLDRLAVDKHNSNLVQGKFGRILYVY